MARTRARSVIYNLCPGPHMRAAPQCIRAAAPPSIQRYLPNGGLNLNREPLPPHLSREWPGRSLAARLWQVAGKLGVDAHVVQRAGRHRGDDGAGVGTVIRRRSVISALAGRDRSDNQPYQQDEPTD